MLSLPTSPEARHGALLPSESQRIPCPVPHVPRSDLRDWQLLDNAAQKAVATVSMIDCLWEKLTKVSDDLETLQQRLPALEALQAPLQAPAAPAAAEPPEPPEPPCSKAEMEEFMKVCALEEETNAQFAELKQLMQQKFETFSEELTQVKLMAEEDKSSSAMSRISKELDQVRESLQAQDQRLDERLKSSMETLELSQSSAIERLRWSFREQMQDIARQEQSLNQVKQMLVDRCDEALTGLRRLELTVQSDAAARHSSQQICSQQMDGLHYRVESLEGQQLKFSKSSEEMRRRMEANLEDTRSALETQLSQELQQAVQTMQKQLQAQKQEFAAQSEEISESLRKHFQQALNLLQDQGQKLEEAITQAVGSLREEIAERLEELGRSELSQRSSLEERSNALLDLGLQKLAKEVAERMDQLVERQHSALAASESRVFEHVESWQKSFQDREAAREAREEKSAAEQLQRMEGVSREMASLRTRLEETRQSIEEGLAASAMNAFQGEMRLWAKMAQFGIAPQ